MQFYSKEEICEYFDIDKSKSEKEIIKILTQMRAATHPDKKGEPTEEEKNKWETIDAAKKFLRNNNNEVMIPLSEIHNFLSVVNNEDMQMTLSKDNIEEKILNTSKRIIETTKENWKPAKITSTTVAAIITAIWSFPSIITEHPILNSISLSNYFYSVLSMIWVIVLYVCCTIWLLAYYNERKMKRLLEVLENEDNQFEIFSEFVKYYYNSKSSKTSFTVKDIEEYVERWIYYKRLNRFYPTTTKFKRETSSNRYFNGVKDIIPEVSKMIIARALEKKVIIKEETHSWYDSYIINGVN